MITNESTVKHSFTVEYIALIGAKKAFGKTVQSFNMLLGEVLGCKLGDKSKEINWKTENGVELLIGYELLLSETTNQDFSCHTKFIYNETLDKIPNFEKFLRKVRTLYFELAQSEPTILWNDIALYYSRQAYELIHKVENSMRKLLTKFAMTKLGQRWEDTYIPKDVQSKAPKNHTDKKEHSYLYNIDFIDLSSFLFANLPSDSNKLLEMIKNAKKLEDLQIDTLKGLLPVNNWDKSFASFIELDTEKFKKDWDSLYKLRCKVAHNREFTRADYDETVKLVEKTQTWLDKAIGEIDKVNLTVEVQEEIAESFAEKSGGQLVFEFLEAFKRLANLLQQEQALQQTLYNSPISHRLKHPRYLKGLVIGDLDNSHTIIVTSQGKEDLKKLQRIRNEIVHTIDGVSDEELYWGIDFAKSYYEKIQNKEFPL